jgi:hypothetical protein
MSDTTLLVIGAQAASTTKIVPVILSGGTGAGCGRCRGRAIRSSSGRWWGTGRCCRRRRAVGLGRCSRPRS